MAHSISNLAWGQLGQNKTARATVTLTEYTTGGEVLTAAELGLRYITAVFTEDPQGEATHRASWDGTPGTTAEISIYVDDAISGVPAESGTSNTDVFTVLAVGY